MNEIPARNPADAGNGAAPAEDGIEQIRRLLIAPEQQELGELRRRLDDPQVQAQHISRVLPAAVRLASTKDEQLTSAITPAVERALRESVRRDPSILTDTVFPVIGPAIRKAIAEAFGKLVQSLNQTLTHSLSIRGLKWRFEAFRTGKSFAEVVLARTLKYQVEHVFLIHLKTGLLLQHVQAPNVEIQDPAIIAGMLSAIQDFTRDSFNTGKAEQLEAFEVGELHVWIETGPHAALAAVIRGNAPLEIRTTLESTLEQIHEQQTQALEAFEGDDAPFVATRPALEECLSVELAEGSEPGTRPVIWLAAALAVLLLAGAALALHMKHQREAADARAFQEQLARDASARADAMSQASAQAQAESLAKEREDRAEARWRAAVARLKAEPGIVVTEAVRDGESYQLAGLRDPLAADPNALLAQSGIEVSRVAARWEPYYALTPSLVLRRAHARIQPPPGVTLELRGDVLFAKGAATAPWIESARRQAEAIPGVTRLDTTDLLNETEQYLAAKRKALEETVLLFSEGVTLAPDEISKVPGIATQIENLRRAAAENRRGLRVTIIGQTSPEGPERLNRSLARERADAALRLLLKNRIDPSVLTPLGMSSVQPVPSPINPEIVLHPARSVTFHVTFDPRSTITPEQ